MLRATSSAVAAAATAWSVLDQVVAAGVRRGDDAGARAAGELAGGLPGRRCWPTAASASALFRGVLLKPNERECLGAPRRRAGRRGGGDELAARAGRPVFCTRGERGILVADAGRAGDRRCRATR